MLGLAPSVSAFIEGRPWLKGTSAPPKPVEPNFKLDSFEDSGFKSYCNSNGSSTTIALSQYSPSPPCYLGSENQVLQMPRDASIIEGGWMDTSGWFFQLLWEKVQHLSLNELYDKCFTREVRPAYGETHGYTRKSGADTLVEAETFQSNKIAARERHKKQERDRRSRHRFLQREADNITPTFAFDMAKANLNRVKEEAKKAFPNDADDLIDDNGRKNRQSERSAKVHAGKDDQLTAALLTIHLTSIVICRQYEHIIAQQEQIARLEDKLAAVSHSFHAEHGSFLRVKSPAPIHEWRGLKRDIHEVEKSMTILQRHFASPRPLKRQRHLPGPTYPSRHHDPQNSLPPSPTPSREGVTCFCSN